MRTQNFLAVSFVVAVITSACRNGPQSYDDCILQYMKAGMDSSAVATVRNSCRAKFPPKAVAQAEERLLSLDELRLLGGRAEKGMGTDITYLGNLYNENDGLVVTRLEVIVTTTIANQKVARPYQTDVQVWPKSTGLFNFKIIPGDEGATYSWSIARAWGRPTS